MSDTKTCSKCGVEYPATAEYFPRNNAGLFGLYSQCKTCKSNKEAIRRSANPDKERERHKRYRDENVEKIRESQARYRLENPDKVRARRRRRYERQREDILRDTRRYYEANRERYKEWNKKWADAHPDKMKMYQKRYDKRHPDIVRLNSHRRRARKNGLPSIIVDEHRALKYFKHTCAVCGRPPGLWHVLTLDHWIAVSDPRPDNPGTVPANMIPLCHSTKGANGQGSCNLSKGSKDPIVWLNQQFGARKAKHIIKRINDYFEWVRLQEQEAA